MSNLGMGVMLNMLMGNDGTADIVKSALGKTISSLELREDALRFVMDDGQSFRLFDDGQSCCERRYMSADGDNLAEFVGAKLLSIETRQAPDGADEGGDPHEVQFLAVITDRGECVLSSHNEHNGYYGGFSIRAVAS